MTATEGDPGEALTTSLAHPLVPVKLGKETVDFLLDTGATYSSINCCKGSLGKLTPSTAGTAGGETSWPLLRPMKCTSGGNQLTHEFLYVPDCPFPGPDLLCNLNAQITFSESSVTAPCSPRGGAEGSHVPADRLDSEGCGGKRPGFRGERGNSTSKVVVGAWHGRERDCW